MGQSSLKVSKMRKKSDIVTQAVIGEQARKIAERHGLTEERLRFNRKWVRGFARRHQLRRRGFNTDTAMSKEDENLGMRAWHRGLRIVIRGASFDGSKYGRFPPITRFNMDETGFGFWPTSRSTYTTATERAGTGRIRKPGGRRSRFGTAVATVHMGHQLMPLLLLFKGKGELKWEEILELEGRSVHWCVPHKFNPSAWMNQGVLAQWFKETFLPAARAIVAAPREILLLLDNCGSCHQSPEFDELAAANNVVVHYGPPNLTGRWQPADAAVLKTFKDLFAKELEAWKKRSKRNRQLFRSKKWSAQQQRVCAIEFAALAWRALHSADYEAMHNKAWFATGCGMTADGTEDHKIHPQGHDDYLPPSPPGGRPAAAAEALFDELFGSV